MVFPPDILKQNYINPNLVYQKENIKLQLATQGGKGRRPTISSLIPLTPTIAPPALLRYTGDVVSRLI